MKNYYDILGVSEDASSEDIKKAFKNIAKKEHPDRGGNETIFKEANEAYDTLKNPEKKQEYDTIRKYGEGFGGQGGNFNFTTGDFDIFEDFFSGFGGKSPFRRTHVHRQRPQVNRSINVKMAVSLKEAMMAHEKTISYKLPSGKEEFATVKIPAGVQNGVTFKYRNLGDDSNPNLPRGDLLVQMSVLECDGYTRQQNDLFTEKTIDCFQAVRGTEFKLKTLDDNIIKVKVPAGTQPGTILSVKGRGMPVHQALNIRGNLYVKIVVLIPQLSQTDLNKIKDL